MKQVDQQSSADARTLDIPENTTAHNGKMYDVGMLWADDNVELSNIHFSAQNHWKIG